MNRKIANSELIKIPKNHLLSFDVESNRNANTSLLPSHTTNSRQIQSS